MGNRDAIKSKEIPEASLIVARVQPGIDCRPMHIQRVTHDRADAGVLSKFHCKHSGKRVTRAGLSSN